MLTVTIGSLELRPFAWDDRRELYCIRYHPTVRPFMSRSQMVPFAAHLKWIENSLLGNRDFMLFLVRRTPTERAIGIAQLKISGDTAEIGVIFREPSEHQTITAVVSAVMVHLAFVELGLQQLISYIIPTHTSAVTFNQRFGAQTVSSDIPNMVKLHMTREVGLANPAFRRLFRRIEPRLVVSGVRD